jgi:uncharacterized membrane protein
VPSPDRPSGESAGAGAWLGWAGGMVAAWWRRRPLGPALQVFAAIVVTWLVVNVPVMMINMQNWRRFLDLNTERVIDWGTSWYVARHFDPFGLEIWNDVPRVTDLSLAVFIACCVGLLLLGLFAKTPPRLAQLAFLVVAIFLITNKVWSQQFTLWLLPLIVLARPKWRAFLAWQIAEVCYFLAFYGELMGASGKQVITEPIFIFASLLRLGTVIMLVVLVIRDILRPEGDVVRRAYPEIGDPDGGLFNDFRLGTAAPHKEGPLPERSGPSPEFTADRPPVVSSV